MNTCRITCNTIFNITVLEWVFQDLSHFIQGISLCLNLDVVLTIVCDK